MTAELYSLVVPIYRNAESIEGLVAAVHQISAKIDGELEAVFVIDGSPDDSRERLIAALQQGGVSAHVIEHSRNFGAFAAVRTGMRFARGRYIAIMAADLQEPPSLVIEFFRRLATNDVDVVAGERAHRNDRGDTASKLYWRLYRRFVLADIPAEGVDVFACTAAVRDVICSMESVNTSLVAQLFWVGFRREMVPYERRPNPGASGWTFRRKLRYLSDSVFAFTDLPVRILWLVGIVGLALALLVGTLVLIGRAAGAIAVPGYAPTIIVISLFASLNLIGLGIIGSYVWRTYETAKGRPGAIIQNAIDVSDPGNDA